MTTHQNSYNNSTQYTELHKSLANYLLLLPEGEQVLSTRELADLFSASLGSISAAMNDLEENGAVTVNRRGRLGSFLLEKSFGALWKIVENGPMVIAQTLPSFSKSEGLATAIFSLLDNAGIETYMTFIRGSYHRLQALRNGRCNAMVMSQLAAEQLCKDTEEIILRLPAQSFVTDHRVFYRTTSQEAHKPLRVGIDPDSFDIKYLTELEFAGCDVEYQNMTYAQIDHNLEKSSVDAAISNIDHLERLKSSQISSRPLSPRVQEMIGSRDTSAVVVIQAGAGRTRTLLQKVLVPDSLLEIQQKVVEGLMVPRY